jgi:nitrous oxide reductase accessory protein NosL
MMVVLALAVAALAAGCSGFQVKSDFAPTMAADAAAAQRIVALAATGDLDPPAARAYLAGPALALNAYYCAATVNLLDFWFKPEKKVFVTAQFYNDLRAAALGAAEAAARAEACPDADALARASRLAQDIVAFDKARRGVR